MKSDFDCSADSACRSKPSNQVWIAYWLKTGSATFTLS